jgi:hypothetical protein
MTRRQTRPRTSESFQAANYLTAGGINVSKRISTSQRAPRVRTVTTSAKEGSINLRYAPHEPRVAEIDTTS